MKTLRSSAGGILFRAIGFLLAGVMVSMVFLGTLDTQSWFFSKTAANMEVTAATTEDIVKILGLDDEVNPKYILLEGSNNLKHDAMIYFAVEGDIDEYILHIDPIKIQTNKKYNIAIEPNINIYQHTKLWEWPWQSGKVKGKVWVKYLNEFISEPIEISFTKKYLREKLIEEVKRQNVEITDIEDDVELRGEITTLITYLASHLKWQEEDNDTSFLMSKSRGEKSSQMQVYGLLGFQSKELKELEFEEVPIEKLKLDSEQSKIISIIAPTLQKYLDEIYNVVVNLVEKINEKIKIIVGLEKEVEILEEERDKFSKDLEKAEEEIENLRSENQRLREENESLRREIESLTLDLSSVRASISQGSSGGGSSTSAPVVVPNEEEPKGNDNPQKEQPKEPDEDGEDNQDPKEPIEDSTADERKDDESPAEDDDKESDQTPKAGEESGVPKGDDKKEEQPKESINDNTHDGGNVQTNPGDATNDNNTGNIGNAGGESGAPSEGATKTHTSTVSESANEKDG